MERADALFEARTDGDLALEPRPDATERQLSADISFHQGASFSASQLNFSKEEIGQ